MLEQLEIVVDVELGMPTIDHQHADPLLQFISAALLREHIGLAMIFESLIILGVGGFERLHEKIGKFLRPIEQFPPLLSMRHVKLSELANDIVAAIVGADGVV